MYPDIFLFFFAKLLQSMEECWYQGPGSSLDVCIAYDSAFLSQLSFKDGQTKMSSYNFSTSPYVVRLYSYTRTVSRYYNILLPPEQSFLIIFPYSKSSFLFHSPAWWLFFCDSFNTFTSILSPSLCFFSKKYLLENCILFSPPPASSFFFVFLLFLFFLPSLLTSPSFFCPSLRFFFFFLPFLFFFSFCVFFFSSTFTFLLSFFSYFCFSQIILISSALNFVFRAWNFHVSVSDLFQPDITWVEEWLWQTQLCVAEQK